MKKGVAILAVLLLATVTVQAQRFAYVDVEKILESISDYKAAQSTLDQAASKWKQEIAAKYSEIDELYRSYQAEQVLLSEKAKQQREEEIVNREKEARKFQKDKFGPEGELFQKRQQLVKPIQDKVYAAIEQYALDRGFDFIFDQSGGVGILYANPKNDKTDDVIKRLQK